MKIERLSYSYEIESTDDDCVKVTQHGDNSSDDVIILHSSQINLFISDLKQVLIGSNRITLRERPTGNNP
ncbi:MAG: hypothetical protein ACOYL3_07140 [Desulfuromonadaceae bacterium]